MPAVSEELVPRDEAHAALAARRELGPDYEAELAERFAARIESRLQERERVPAKRDESPAVAIISLLVAIPLTAIAGSTVGLAGVIAVCAALVLVNWRR
jgi:hypothetical protein